MDEHENMDQEFKALAELSDLHGLGTVHVIVEAEDGSGEIERDEITPGKVHAGVSCALSHNFARAAPSPRQKNAVFLSEQSYKPRTSFAQNSQQKFHSISEKKLCSENSKTAVSVLF